MSPPESRKDSFPPPLLGRPGWETALLWGTGALDTRTDDTLGDLGQGQGSRWDWGLEVAAGWQCPSFFVPLCHTPSPSTCPVQALRSGWGGQGKVIPEQPSPTDQGPLPVWPGVKSLASLSPAPAWRGCAGGQLCGEMPTVVPVVHAVRTASETVGGPRLARASDVRGKCRAGRY